MTKGDWASTASSSQEGRRGHVHPVLSGPLPLKSSFSACSPLSRGTEVTSPKAWRRL